jgi:hypothetical protein
VDTSTTKAVAVPVGGGKDGDGERGAAKDRRRDLANRLPALGLRWNYEESTVVSSPK